LYTPVDFAILFTTKQAKQFRFPGLPARQGMLLDSKNIQKQVAQLLHFAKGTKADV